MPSITIKIDIDIQNYDEVARNKGVLIGGWLHKIPYSNSFIHKKIDDEVYRRIKDGLEKELPRNLVKSLEENGVRAVVEIGE